MDLEPLLGDYRPLMSGVCGYTPRPKDPSSPECGRPATLHAWAGPQDETGTLLTACELHAAVARSIAIDWHAIGPVCDVPGTKWQFFETPGTGFCFWPAAEEAALAELASTPARA